MRTAGGLVSAPARLAGWLERRERPAVAAIALLAALGALARASGLRLWFDELATLYLARIPNVAGLIQALWSGADANPPLYYLLVRAGRALAGGGELGTRLPSLCGCAAMAAGTFAFARRSAGPLGALVALVVSLGTAAFAYSFEARPYAAVAGCCGLAIWCWQRTAAPVRSRWTLSGLAVSLWLAVSLHYYGIFLAAPFLFAEGVRWARRRKPDPAVLAAVILPALLSAVYLPMALSGARHLAGCGSWGGGERPAFLPFFPMAYAGLLPSAGVWIGLGAAAIGLARALDGGRPPLEAPAHAPRPCAEEWALATALALLPVWVFFGTLLAGLPTGYISGYALSAAVGISLLAGFVASGRDAAAVAMFLLLHFVAHQLNSVRLYVRPAPSADHPLYGLARRHPGLPVLMDWAAFGVLHYGPPDVAARVVVLREPGLAHNVRCLETLSPYVPVRFAGYLDFTAAHNLFLLWTGLPSAQLGALEARLAADGFHIERLAVSDKAELALVRRH